MKKNKTADISKYMKEYYQKNKEKHKKRVKKYQIENKEKIKENRKEYLKKNPNYYKEYYHNPENIERIRASTRKAAKKRYSTKGKRYHYLYITAERILRERHKEEFNRVLKELKEDK